LGDETQMNPPADTKTRNVNDSINSIWWVNSEENVKCAADGKKTADALIKAVSPDPNAPRQANSSGRVKNVGPIISLRSDSISDATRGGEDV